MSANYTREEERELMRAVHAGRDPACPRCDVPLDRREVPPRPEVSYVRRRLWLVCPECGRSAVVDRKSVREEPDDA